MHQEELFWCCVNLTYSPVGGKLVDIKCTLLDAIGKRGTEEEAMGIRVTGTEILSREVKNGLFAKVTRFWCCSKRGAWGFPYSWI